jgi:hypothetical protein
MDPSIDDVTVVLVLAISIVDAIGEAGKRKTGRHQGIGTQFWGNLIGLGVNCVNIAKLYGELFVRVWRLTLNEPPVPSVRLIRLKRH